ncbi:hypothetical protein QZH41_009246 [Actinostola sp. cb2023]|nr:hypothetical protein QZH41_009246 [Actinostola sp. cb2023]
MTPCAAEEGLSATLTAEPTIGCYGNTDCFSPDQLTSLDKEGRAVLTEHELDSGDKVVIINVYCPRADPDNEERMEFKMQYYNLLQIRVEALLESGRHVILLGDLNVTHKPIDHCNPGELKSYTTHPSRIWMNQFVKEITVKNITWNSDDQNDKIPTNGDERNGEQQVSLSGTLVDSFRYIHLNQKDAYTNWCTSTGARQTNYGKRLDYILADILLIKQKFKNCIIRPEVEGSDHCPVVAYLKGQISPAKRPPALCTRFMPEFIGKQQKLASYFTKKAVDKPLLQNKGEEKSSRESLQVTTARVKRTNNFGTHPQAKRVKTSQPRKQNNLLQFFGKKSNDSVVSCDDEKASESLPNSGSSSDTKFSGSDSQDSATSGSPSTTPECYENSTDCKTSSESLTKAADQHRQAEVALWKKHIKGTTTCTFVSRPQ